MREMSQETCFLEKSLCLFLCELSMQDFESRLRMQMEMFAEIHMSEPSTTEQADESIVV
jgi:hypothetical protein